MSAHDERSSAGLGTGSPRGPGPGETDLDDLVETGAPPSEDDGEILRAVTEFVDDLVEGADGMAGARPADGSSAD